MRRKSAPIAKQRRKQASQLDTAVITAGEESDITYSADIPEGTDNLITEGMPLELINDSIYTMGDNLLAAGDAADSLLILLISGGAADAFGAGKLLMVLCEMHCIPHLRNMREDFGILLFPKYEAEQERYYHVINPNVVCAMMILTVSDPAQAGLVAEVLSTESKNYIPPLTMTTIWPPATSVMRNRWECSTSSSLPSPMT